MDTGSGVDWTLLPEDIIIHLFSFLHPHDRDNASRVCRTWNKAYTHPTFWHNFEFRFFRPSHVSYLECAKKYGKHMEIVSISVGRDITDEKNACELLDILSKIDERRMTCLTIEFTGETLQKPFRDRLFNLFSNERTATLQCVDFSGLCAPIDDSVIDALSKNHTGLIYLDIQNEEVKTTSDCILRLVERCPNLKDLRLNYSSISNKVFEAFTKDGRDGVEHISIICRQGESCTDEFKEKTWEILTKRIPYLRVTLVFDETCSLGCISSILKPFIPVRTLKLKPLEMYHNIVDFAATHYNETLENLVLSPREPSRELDGALLRVAMTCTLLHSLIVYGVVAKETIDEIFRLHPDMKQRKTHFLFPGGLLSPLQSSERSSLQSSERSSLQSSERSSLQSSVRSSLQSSLWSSQKSSLRSSVDDSEEDD